MSDERIGSTLFLAALVHGVVILGVTFTAVSTGDDVAPSLNVTLVLDTEREELAADTADFIANRDQRAAGQAALGLRPTSRPVSSAIRWEPTPPTAHHATRRRAQSSS